MKRLFLGVLVTLSAISSLSVFAQHYPSPNVDPNQLIDKSRSISDLVEQRAYGLNQAQRNRINQLLTQINETIVLNQPGPTPYPTPSPYPNPYPTPSPYPNPYPDPNPYPNPNPYPGHGISFSQLVITGSQQVSDSQTAVAGLYGAMAKVNDPFFAQIKSMCSPLNTYSSERECIIRGLNNVGSISLDQTQATQILRPLCGPASSYSAELNCLKAGLNVIGSQQGQFVLSSCSATSDSASQVQCIYRGLMI